MVEQTITLNPSESKAVSFEAIPHEVKTYQVSVNGLTGSFRAVSAAKFYMPSVMAVKVTDGLILDMYWVCEFSCLITNNGEATGTYTLTGRDNLSSAYGGPRTWGPQKITLAPGQTYKWRVSYHIDFRRVSAPYVWELWGDWEGDNYSRGEATPGMAVIVPEISIGAISWDRTPPEFAPGTTHTAKATMRNPSNRPWDYTAILRMGTDKVAMASKAFGLDPGQSADIRFSVKMPTAEGVYPVDIEVSSGGKLIAHRAGSVTLTHSWEFTGRLVGRCTRRFIEGPCYIADIDYSIDGVAPNFRWKLYYWAYEYTSTYSKSGNGPASGKISCSGGARLYAHPDPNATMREIHRNGIEVTGDFKRVASISVRRL